MRNNRTAVRALQLLATLLMIASLPTVARSQGLRGTVLSGDAPVGGAVVELIRSPDSVVVAHVFSRGDGSFRFSATPTPAMWLRTRAIGFRPVITPVGSPVDGGFASVTVRLVAAPPVLADVEVSAAAKACGREVGSQQMLAELFDLVRTTDAVISRHLARPDLRFTSEIRFVSNSPGGVSDSTVAYPEHAMLEWPVRAPPLELLRKEGFSRSKVGAEGVGRWFYGVDLQLLQSDWFAAGHCFWVTAAPESEGADAVLLHFEPTGKPKQVDVEGSLLVGTTDGAIRRLKYQHVNLPSWFPRGSSGGEVTFARDTTGIWYPSTWWLRSPVENDPAAALSRPSLVGGVMAPRPRRRAVIGVAVVAGRVTGLRRVEQ